MTYWTRLALGHRSYWIGYIGFRITFALARFCSQSTLTIGSNPLKCLTKAKNQCFSWKARKKIYIKTKKLTSHRLSEPFCMIPLFWWRFCDILKLFRRRWRSGPELNLYSWSSSARKCVSKSDDDKWTPHTGHEFGGGVPTFDDFFIAKICKWNKKIKDFIKNDLVSYYLIGMLMFIIITHL